MSTHLRIGLGLEYENHLDVRQVDDLENAVGGRGGFIARFDVGEVNRKELIHHGVGVLFLEKHLERVRRLSRCGGASSVLYEYAYSLGLRRARFCARAVVLALSPVPRAPWQPQQQCSRSLRLFP